MNFEQKAVDIGKQESVEALCFWTERVALEQYEMSHERQAESDVTVPPLSERLLSWLRTNFRRKITLSDAAEEIGASNSTITHSIKQQTGQTFAEHLNSIRVSEAKRLLAYSNLSLTEISQRSGFSDQSYFTKVFRKRVNLTPSMFRKMLDNRDQKECSCASHSHTT